MSFRMPSRRRYLVGVGLVGASSLGGCLRLQEAGRTDPNGAGSRRLVFDFDSAVEMEEGRVLSIRVFRLSVFDADGSVVRSYDIGTRGEEPEVLTGAGQPRELPNQPETARWFHRRTVVRLTGVPADAQLAEGTMVCRPAQGERDVEADIRLDGAQTDHVNFGREGPPRQVAFSLRPES